MLVGMIDYLNHVDSVSSNDWRYLNHLDSMLVAMIDDI